MNARLCIKLRQESERSLAGVERLTERLLNVILRDILNDVSATCLQSVPEGLQHQIAHHHLGRKVSDFQHKAQLSKANLKVKFKCGLQVVVCANGNCSRSAQRLRHGRERTYAVDSLSVSLSV